MNLRRVKHMLLRLSPEQKIVGVGSLIVLASAFLPWYSVIFNFNEKGITESGFSGDLGVIGFVIFLLTSLGLIFLMSDHLHIKLPRFGMKKENITMFLMSESAFLALLTLAVYTKRSLEYTNAELRFGLYLTLIGSVLAAFAQYAEMQKSETKDVQAFFGQEEIEVEREVKIEDFESDEGEYEDPIKNYEPAEVAEETTEIELEEDPEVNELFEETVEAEPEQESFFQEENEEAKESSDTTETALDDVETFQETSQNEKKSQNDQASYFTREAGIEPKSNIKVDIDSIKPVEKLKKEPEKTVQQNMSFYDDL